METISRAKSFYGVFFYVVLLFKRNAFYPATSKYFYAVKFQGRIQSFSLGAEPM